jgi:hypothetical protein
MCSEVTLYTSIPPYMSRPFSGREFGPAWQTACISSWKAAGFQSIVSLNTAEEIPSLSGRFAKDITFVELPSNRTRALIADLLKAAALSNREISGIINADVLIAPHSGIIPHLFENMNGMALAERINLNRYTLHLTGRPCMGFDALFFKTGAIAKIKMDERWRIGEAWWDYWLPMAFQAAGFEINTFPSPILIHIDHEQSWDLHTLHQSFPRLLEFLRSTDFHNPILASAIEVMPEEYEAKHFYALIDKIYDWFHSRAPLWQPEPGSVDDLATHLLYALSIPPPPPAIGRGRVIVRRLINRLHLHRTIELLGLG